MFQDTKRVTKSRISKMSRQQNGQKNEDTKGLTKLGSCNGVEIKHSNDYLVNFINTLLVYQGHQGG